jgi:hypothetical protein
MAHAQKPDFVLRRNGRAHLNWRGRRGGSVQSTTGSRGVRISDNNAGYTMFRGSVKRTSYPLHSPVSPSLPLPCVTVLLHVSPGLYLYTLLATAKPSPVACSTTLRYEGAVSSNIILFKNGIFRLAAILRYEKSEKTARIWI